MSTTQKTTATSRKLVKPQAAVAASQARVLPDVPKDLLDSMNIGLMTGEAVNATAFAFKKALIERSLNAEMSHHLGYGRFKAFCLRATALRSRPTSSPQSPMR